MLPDRVSNPGPLTYELGALPIALRGPAAMKDISYDLCCRSSLQIRLASMLQLKWMTEMVYKSRIPLTTYILVLLQHTGFTWSLICIYLSIYLSTPC